jgi:hypothetical protein
MVAPFDTAAAAMSPKDEPSQQQQAPQQVQQAQQAQPHSGGDNRSDLEAYCARRGLAVGAALRAFLRGRLNSQP